MVLTGTKAEATMGGDAALDLVGVGHPPQSIEHDAWRQRADAHIVRADLPAHAVGKDYLGAPFIARTPGGSGVQVNTFGVAGVLLGWHEGLEVNLIGLTFGFNPSRLSLKLPVVGNVGLRRPSQPRVLVGTPSAPTS